MEGPCNNPVSPLSGSILPCVLFRPAEREGGWALQDVFTYRGRAAVIGSEVAAILKGREGAACAAQVIWVEGQKQPLMVRKSDGGFGYGTTDMAALSQRIHVREPLQHHA